jgi:chromosome segregation ATPase
MKRPAASFADNVATRRAKRVVVKAKRTKCSKRTRSTDTKTCKAIIAKLVKIEGLPSKTSNFVERIKAGLKAKAKDPRRLGTEEATVLLRKAVNEISSALRAKVQDYAVAADGVNHEEKRRQEAAVAAEQRLATLRQDAIDYKSTLKRSAREIETQRETIREAKAAKNESEADAKNIEHRKHHLVAAERDAFAPLREAPAKGLAGKKCLMTLRRTGKAFGFHNELMHAAGTVLRKSLVSRRTFDNDVLRHVAREFEKRSNILDTALRESEQAVEARKDAVELATECLAAAKAGRKKCARELVAVEEAITEGQENLANARREVRKLPAHIMTMVKQLERAQLELERFTNGPQATCEEAFGAPSMRPKQLASDEGSVENMAPCDTDVDEE